jgi:metal-responsive CopG/Arc/MetJ family transcriptional regulator
MGGLVIPGYTQAMKTAISIPDETYAQAEDRAAQLGLSRSEFFTRAIRRYLEQLDAESVTDQIDAAIALLADDDSTAAAVYAGRRALGRAEGTW